jgi:hypothetical protein
MMRGVPVIALAFVACGTGTGERRLTFGAQAGQTLVGAWDAQLSLGHPYQLALHEPTAKRICGTIGFVDNRYSGSEWSRAENPQLGVYDLDLSLLGLDWLEDQTFPLAVASALTTRPPRASVAPDSVRIVLNPAGQERIVLRGRYDFAGISGAWKAQSPRGTASGSFWMTPHVSARATSPSCT